MDSLQFVTNTSLVISVGHLSVSEKEIKKKWLRSGGGGLFFFKNNSKVFEKSMEECHAFSKEFVS